MITMTTSTIQLPVPAWDLADRLAKSLRESGISIQMMARHLGVHRNSVSAWINGRGTPSRPVIIMWASATHTPYPWIADGIDPASPPPGVDLSALYDTENPLLLPRLESNQQPFGQWFDNDLPAAAGM